MKNELIAKNIVSLKSDLQRVHSVNKKLKLLKDRFKDSECVILTAGPSFKDNNKVDLINLLKDKLVISVKQTVIGLEEYTDFHLVNPFNYVKYNNILDRTIKISLSANSIFYPIPFYDADINLKLIKDHSLHESIAIKQNYEKFRLDKEVKRPLGPGIMHELGIYLPVLLGCKRIYVIGWDLGNKNDSLIERYYEKENIFLKIRRSIILHSLPFFNIFYNRIENLVRLGLFSIGIDVKINLPGVTIDEAKLIANSTNKLYKWLKSKNIDLYVISNRSLLDEIIPRVKITDLIK